MTGLLKYKNLNEELIKIRFEVVKFIYEALLFIAVICLGIYLNNIIFSKFDFNAGDKVSALIFVISIVIILFFCRLKVNTNNYRIFLYILVAIFTFTICFSSYLYGVDMSTLNLMIAITILSITIVIGVQFAFVYIFFVFAWMVFITIQQTNGTIPFRPDLVPPNFNTLIMIFTLFIVILKLSKLGYSQIEDYFSKAVASGKKLEEINLKLQDANEQLESLNRELDERVKQRTKTLQKNFNKQIESMYSSASIGSIAKPLIHDLTTPLNAVEGTLDILYKDEEFDKELFDLARESIKQMNEIIFEAKELMLGKDFIQEFNVKIHLERVIKILSAEFCLNQVELELIDNLDNSKVKGIVSLFERVVTNILVNAIEELKNVSYQRKINITTYNQGKFIVLEITDNGRGIPKEYWNKIFEEEYSLKHSFYNLGLGLPFVRSTMKYKFHGDVSLESEVDNYTKFTLLFKRL